MCAPNKTKKRNKALSYLFRIHLVITLSAVVFNVYAFVHSHISYAADLYLNTYESSFDKLTKVE